MIFYSVYLQYSEYLVRIQGRILIKMELYIQSMIYRLLHKPVSKDINDGNCFFNSRISISTLSISFLFFMIWLEIFVIWVEIFVIWVETSFFSSEIFVICLITLASSLLVFSLSFASSSIFFFFF